MYDISMASWVTFWVFMGGLYAFTTIADWKNRKDD